MIVLGFPCFSTATSTPSSISNYPQFVTGWPNQTCFLTFDQLAPASLPVRVFFSFSWEFFLILGLLGAFIPLKSCKISEISPHLDVRINHQILDHGIFSCRLKFNKENQKITSLAFE